MKEEKGPVGKSVQMVTFVLGGDEYGVDIKDVHEVIVMQKITKLPNLPAYIEGVVNLRGKVIPIIDLRKHFNLPYTDNPGQMKIIVVEINDTLLGLIVNKIGKVLTVLMADISPSPVKVSGIGREYLIGIGNIGGELLLILDLKKIFIEEIKLQ